MDNSHVILIYCASKDRAIEVQEKIKVLLTEDSTIDFSFYPDETPDGKLVNQLVINN